MTNEQIARWVQDAIADGWTHGPIYEHEPEETAMRLERDGFRASVFMRPILSGHSLYAWAPDDCAVDAPERYDMQQLRRNVHKCGKCGQYVDDATVRVGFANRACRRCAPALRKEIETPGWCD